MLLEVEFQTSETVSSAADVDEIIEFLLDVLPHKSRRNHFICLDGIDECKASEMKNILCALERLACAPRLSCKVFYSIPCKAHKLHRPMRLPKQKTPGYTSEPCELARLYCCCVRLLLWKAHGPVQLVGFAWDTTRQPGNH